MSIFSTQRSSPNHPGLIELPAGAVPDPAPIVPSARDIVESVLTESVEPEDQSVPVHEIAAEAYLLFEARGCQDGHDVEDWLAAEALIRQRRASRVVPPLEAAPDQRN